MSTMLDLEEPHAAAASIALALPELPDHTPAAPELLTEPTQDPIEIVVVSAIDGHDYYATPAVRSKAALTKSGTLYLVEGARSDPMVLSYISSLDRRKRLSEGRIVPYTSVQEVPYTVLQQLYSNGMDDESGLRASLRSTAEEEQIKSIIAEAIREFASDVFIEVYGETAEIHYRIAGDVERRFGVECDLAKRLIRTVCDAMSESFSDPHYDPSRDQTGLLARVFTDTKRLERVRISCGPTFDKEHPFLNLRFHYKLGKPRPIVELGFSLDHQEQVDAAAQFSYGILLFSGETGAGKSTSLANQVGHYQLRDNWVRKVITLEDPPEIPIYGAVPKAVSRKGLDRAAEGQAWLSGFDTLMRWNPDWIIGGELRLRETMDSALKSALSGHLTWGMLHANSATHTLSRLQEAGIEIGYLSDPSIFRLLANQSLVPQLCPHCSEPFLGTKRQIAKGLTERVHRYCTPETVRVRGDGCSRCYRGALRMRTVVAEVITTDRKQLSIFREQGANAMRRHWIQECGGVTKTAHMIQKINAGLLDPVNAERFATPLNTDDLGEVDG